MSDDLETRLLAAEERLLEKQRLERTLAQVRDELSAERKRLRGLRKRLAAEEHDVAVLEGPGLTRLFASLTGNRDDALEKEREEAVAARLELDECAAEVDGLAAERTLLRERIEGLDDAEALLQAARAEKETVLRGRGGEIGARLDRIRTLVAAARRQEREAGDAVDDGNQTWVLLRRAEDLQRAADAIRGFTSSDRERRDALLSQAHLTRRRAHRCLRRFRRELRDLNLDAPIWPAAAAAELRPYTTGVVPADHRGVTVKRLSDLLAEARKAIRAEGERLEEERLHLIHAR